MSSSPELWKATYEAKTPEALADAYRDWAENYDHDTRKVMGYVGPDVAANLLDNCLESKECKILDVGCGTGLVGEVLNDMGYGNLEAMDYSKAMISEAEKKGVYSNLFQDDLSRKLSVPDNYYDATICVGTFTYAHVGPEAFTEMTRVTRPNGYVCFTIRGRSLPGLWISAENAGAGGGRKWELMEMRHENYLIHEDVQAKFCTYMVLDA